MLKSPKVGWREIVVIWAPFERQKIEVHIFERVKLSDFGMWKFTTKEGLNRQIGKSLFRKIL